MENSKTNYISNLLSNNGYIAVNRVLIKVLGLNAAILIGELCSEYNYYNENGQLVNNEWFYSTVPNIEENTGLNKYFQDESIKVLKAKKLIETKVMGMPSKRYFLIKFNEIEKIFKNISKSTKKTAKIKGSDIVATKEVNQSLPRKQNSRHQGSKSVANKEVSQSLPRKQSSHYQGSKPIATKEVNHLLHRKQTSRHQGSEPVATNNNNNNNKIKTINNNLILSQEKIRKDKEFSEFIKNIRYDDLNQRFTENKENTKKELLENIVAITNNAILSNQKYINISGNKIEKQDFINKILKLSDEHIEYILNSLKENTTKIKNIKAYILAVLYNSIDTIDIYYQNRIKNDMIA